METHTMWFSKIQVYDIKDLINQVKRPRRFGFSRKSKKHEAVEILRVRNMDLESHWTRLSLKRSQQSSLEELLHNKEFQRSFRSFLQSEFSEENLDFWLACEDYRRLSEQQQQQQQQTRAQFIYREFLQSSAQREVGVCNQDDWISAVHPVIEKRIQKYSEGEIRFNLMAIVSDRKMIYERKISELQTQLTEDEPMDTDQSSTFVSSEIAKYQLLIETESQKLQRYKIENIRRKHNYLPFIMELLKTLAEYQQLMPLVEKAKEKQSAKKAQEAK